MNPQEMLDRLMLLLNDFSCVCTVGCKGCPLHKYIMIDTDSNYDMDICDVLDSLKRNFKL